LKLCTGPSRARGTPFSKSCIRVPPKSTGKKFPHAGMVMFTLRTETTVTSLGAVSTVLPSVSVNKAVYRFRESKPPPAMPITVPPPAGPKAGLAPATR